MSFPPLLLGFNLLSRVSTAVKSPRSFLLLSASTSFRVVNAMDVGTRKLDGSARKKPLFRANPAAMR